MSQTIADRLGRLTVYENLRQRGLTHQELEGMSAEELFIEWFQYNYGDNPDRARPLLYVWNKIQTAVEGE